MKTTSTSPTNYLSPHPLAIWFKPDAAPLGVAQTRMMTQPPRSLVPQTWRQPQWRRRWQCDKDGWYQTEGGLWQQERSGRRGDWNARRHEWKRGALADSAPGVRTKVLQTHRKQASRGYRAQSRLARRGETQPQSRRRPSRPTKQALLPIGETTIGKTQTTQTQSAWPRRRERAMRQGPRSRKQLGMPRRGTRPMTMV